jgi:DNA repair exonuclease SbcCD ATPase subunit
MKFRQCLNGLLCLFYPYCFKIPSQSIGIPIASSIHWFNSIFVLIINFRRLAMKKWIFLTLMLTGAVTATYAQEEGDKKDNPEKRKERIEARKEKLRAEGRTEEEIAEIMKKKEEGRGEGKGENKGERREGQGGLSEEEKNKIREKLKADGKTDAEIEEIMKKNRERMNENGGRPRGPMSEEEKKKIMENMIAKWREQLKADGKTEEEIEKIINERKARFAEEAKFREEFQKLREEWPNMTAEQKKEVIEKRMARWKEEGLSEEEIKKRAEKFKERIERREERKENKEEKK